jgi:hypothetical protein
MFGSRKKLAEHCQRVIAEGLAAGNSGRLETVRPSAPPAEAAKIGGEAITA